MKKPTQQDAPGLTMAKEVVTSEGVCPDDIPAMLDALIDEGINSPLGRPALDELFDLASELRKSGASTSEELHKTDFDRGLGFALTMVLARIKTLQ
ncbi:hypothetical protein ACFPU0_25510 [Pseudomonas sp. GCM10022186]|uniref:hypothetical protein n=1 Tax=Pseudomonas sp. GCM10022186 TaxID=3252650 RepID=UPI0036208CA9